MLQRRLKPNRPAAAATSAAPGAHVALEVALYTEPDKMTPAMAKAAAAAIDKAVAEKQAKVVQ